MSVSHAETRIKGKSLIVPSAEISGRTVITMGKWLKIATVRDEDLVEGDTISDAEPLLSQVKQAALKADLFTFAQRLPDTTPKHSYAMEWENVAAVPITTYADWWKNRTEYSIRKGVNKAKKLGVETRVVEFNDDFVRGICKIYAETPVRQGKAFWHYKKDVQTVKHEMATYLDRSVFLGAYHGDELIGTMKMTYVGPAAMIMQILSAQKHFDKRPNNALIAKAIEVCESDGKSYLVYGSFVYHNPDSSLTEFKRRNGFEAVLLPRYYVPLTLKGKLALKFGVHREIAAQIPKPLLKHVLKIRSLWYQRFRAGVAQR